MTQNGTMLIVRNLIGNYRNVLSNRYLLPSYQQHATLKQSIEQKLGLPFKPKKPLTPYFRFMAQIRPSVMQKNPEAKVTDVVRLIAKQWAIVDPAVRQKLETEYKNEMTTYSTSRLKYEESLTNEQRNELKQAKLESEEAKEKRELKKKKKELGKPKKPMTGFLAFMQAKQFTRGDIPFKEWQQALVKLWEGLPEKEKASYQTQSKRAMETYKREIQEWEEKMIRLGHIDMVRNEALIQPKSKTRPTRAAVGKE